MTTRLTMETFERCSPLLSQKLQPLISLIKIYHCFVYPSSRLPFSRTAVTRRTIGGQLTILLPWRITIICLPPSLPFPFITASHGRPYFIICPSHWIRRADLHASLLSDRAPLC